ncbi:FAD-dependent oxidoreductase [Streptantibioticus rubrisoli]|uniref:FAD-dependent monooxygenase n=1 Tax=Streptantibioticus rubrisoli TaxID=1387313 RepID=A0ABT1P691_9ACTN|nr:NAD(P)/FAD-dependent oxidoreductase [Streptantibioticus rubrisoli]MCQ4040896.1 FAD-dependent monooxygenase [Streptantibioticus rubrisoli]
MTHIRTALVVGGGIAGPVAAMALRKAGVDATVYEAYRATADGVGGGLSIAPNGLNALGVLTADDAVRRIGTPMTAMVVQSWTGKRLAEFGGLPGLPTMQFVWRSELYRALYDEAARRGIRTEHGKRLVHLTDTGDEVTAHFADGTQATADILVGADGIRSTTRTLIDPAAPRPRYTGLISFGARLTDTGAAPTGGKMHMVFGKRAFFGYQVLDDGSGGWFVNLPHRAPITLAETRQVPAEEWLRVLREAFADDRTPALQLLRRTEPADLLVVGPMEDIPTVPTWHRGRTVLIGDAAHATSPSSGQGASLAAESAVELARCLRDLPHEQAFAAFERLRRARAEKIIAAAARTNSDKAAGPIARVLRDLLMPTTMRLLAKPEKMAWQYDHRIPWDAPVTRTG